MPQETRDAAKYMTVTKADGTVIAYNGVTLPDGTHLTPAEYEARKDKEAALKKEDAEAMHKEMTVFSPPQAPLL